VSALLQRDGDEDVELEGDVDDAEEADDGSPTRDIVSPSSGTDLVSPGDDASSPASDVASPGKRRGGSGPKKGPTKTKPKVVGKPWTRTEIKALKFKPGVEIVSALTTRDTKHGVEMVKAMGSWHRAVDELPRDRTALGRPVGRPCR
jgi:hypothetical protein